MRFVRRLFLLFIALIIVLVAVSYLLPRHVSVARSITINAAPEAVFPLVNSLQAGQAWSPWLSRDPEAKLVYSGPDSGIGNTLEWSSDHPNVGNGKQVITASEAPKRVETDLDFGEEMGTAKAAFVLEPAGSGTLITWSLDTDMGMSPMGRWLGLMMDGWIGADYEKGLANLKSLAESN